MVKKSDYKLCILAAGRGRRLGGLTEYVNKSLVPVGYKPALAHIFEKVDPCIQVVIAVGYLKDSIQQFVEICYPDRDVAFVEVDRYEGEFTGPGYSLLQCKDLLQCPFVLTACDTLVLEDIPFPSTNWVGAVQSIETENYCSVQLEGDLVQAIHYKEDRPDNEVFVGLAGIKDYVPFWDTLEQNDRKLVDGEIQLANGLFGLIEYELKRINFTWFDTGNPESLASTQESYGGTKNLDKDSEFIYFLNGDVIKYFPEPEWVEKRVVRSKLLDDLCPNISYYTKNFYKYQKVEGQEMARLVDGPLCERFLSWCSEKLWISPDLSEADLGHFHSVCREFYKDKTLNRVSDFYRMTGVSDRPELINGERVSSLESILEKLDWRDISKGIPVRFHGDLHFDNVLITDTNDFCLLDWRQDFGGILEYGDIYYDLSKMFHGVTIAHEAIKENRFFVDVQDDVVDFDFWVNQRLVTCRQVIEKYICDNGYDLVKVKLMMNLIFLNMSPLHPYPFNLLLYYLGKLGLHQILGSGRD